MSRRRCRIDASCIPMDETARAGDRRRRRPQSSNVEVYVPRSLKYDGGELRGDSVIIGHMARCTAPREGHRTASGRTNRLACGGRYGGGWGGGYSYTPSYTPTSYPSYPSSVGGGGRSSGGGGGSGGRTQRARWSRSSSTVLYTPAEIRTLTQARIAQRISRLLPAGRPTARFKLFFPRHSSPRQLHRGV
jgi:hypothetical protein